MRSFVALRVPIHLSSLASCPRLEELLAQPDCSNPSFLIIIIIIIILVIKDNTPHNTLVKQIQDKPAHGQSKGMTLQDSHDLAEERDGSEMLRGFGFDVVQVTGRSLRQNCIAQVSSQA